MAPQDLRGDLLQEPLSGPTCRFRLLGWLDPTGISNESPDNPISRPRKSEDAVVAAT